MLHASRELTQAQTGTGKRRVGWGVTGSAHKSVSPVALVRARGVGFQKDSPPAFQKHSPPGGTLA